MTYQSSEQETNIHGRGHHALSGNCWWTCVSFREKFALVNKCSREKKHPKFSSVETVDIFQVILEEFNVKKSMVLSVERLHSKGVLSFRIVGGHALNMNGYDRFMHA